jgi:hypothetical protein
LEESILFHEISKFLSIFVGALVSAIRAALSLKARDSYIGNFVVSQSIQLWTVAKTSISVVVTRDLHLSLMHVISGENLG